MLNVTLFDIPLTFLARNEILEQIKRGEFAKRDFSQLISINPENMVTILHDKRFKDVVVTSQNHVADGTGVVWAVRFLTGKTLVRTTGVDLMKWLLSVSEEYSLRVLLIGGKENLADSISECYKQKYPRLSIQGIQGVSNIRQPTKEEENEIFRIVSTTRPHIVFVSFGSPVQEIWIDDHKDQFAGSYVIGVGGAFDFIAQKVPRAPLFIQHMGLEWLFRLIHQPWRIFRQAKLIIFVYVVFKEKIRQWRSKH